MNQDYVSLETAKLLKEVGYDECCRFAYKEERFSNRDEDYHCDEWLENTYTTENYNNRDNGKYVCYFSKPLLYFAQKWLREKHNIHIEVSLENFTDGYIWGYQILYIGEDCSDNSYDGEFKTYQLALDAGIAKACKIIKEEN